MKCWSPSKNFLDGKAKICTFTDGKLLFEIHLYLYTWTVLPLGFWPQIALTGKSFWDWSPKGIVVCTSLVLPFMAKCQSTGTRHGKYILPLSPRGIKLKASTFQETGLNSRLNWMNKRRALWSIPAEAAPFHMTYLPISWDREKG